MYQHTLQLHKISKPDSFSLELNRHQHIKVNRTWRAIQLFCEPQPVLSHHSQVAAAPRPPSNWPGCFSTSLHLQQSLVTFTITWFASRQLTPISSVGLGTPEHFGAATGRTTSRRTEQTHFLSYPLRGSWQWTEPEKASPQPLKWSSFSLDETQGATGLNGTAWPYWWPRHTAHKRKSVLGLERNRESEYNTGLLQNHFQ